MGQALDTDLVCWFIQGMKTIGLFEAKTRLSALCARVSGTGEEVLITRRGRPVARLVPPRKPVRRSPAGILADLKRFESAHGSLQNLPEDFPEVWTLRTRGSRDPLEGDPEAAPRA